MTTFIESYSPNKDTLEEEIERYYKYLNERESQIFLSRLIEYNKDKIHDPFYSTFFSAIKRGSEKRDIAIIICTASRFKSMLKSMIGIPLVPFSGFKAVRDILSALLEESTALSFGGVYDSDINKMFIIIKNPEIKDISNMRLEIVYKFSSFTQGYTLLHEMCHYFAANYHDEYLNLFKTKCLVPYYDTIFREFVRVFLKEKISDNTISQFRTIFLDVFENTHVNSDIYRFTDEEFYRLIDECHAKLKAVHNDFGDLWKFLVIILNSDQFDREILRYVKRAKAILRDAYKQNGWNISDKIHHFQELVHTSEVIAVAAMDQYKSPEYIQLLTKIFK